MVYIIRHKGFWEYAPGRGYHDQGFHQFIKMINPPKAQTLFITRKNMFYFPFRYLHNYRNIRRAGVQFFQGNQHFTNIFTLMIRTMYEAVPDETYQRNGGMDMLVHKGERHWELLTYNQHPIQQDMYEVMNYVAHETHGEKTEEEVKLYETFDENLKMRLEEKRRTLGLEPHETLSVEDIRLAHMEEMKLLRGAKGSKFYTRTSEEKQKDFNEANPRRVSYFY